MTEAIPKDAFSNPVQPDGRIVFPGDARRVPDAVDDHTNGESTAICEVCGAAIPPRSIVPGRMRCPRHRDTDVVAPAGPKRPDVGVVWKSPEQRAPVPPSPAPAARPFTREHVIEIAWKNGSLTRLVEYLKIEGERAGHLLDDDRAMEMAKHIIADYGVTYGNERAADIMAPHIEPAAPDALQRLGMGTRPSGWRVKGQARALKLYDLIFPDRKRRAEQRQTEEAAARAAKRTRARRVRAVLVELADAPTRDKVAGLSGLGLSDPEIAAQLGVSRQAVEKHRYKISRG
jgi:hypothetical protein